jgi:hypothetical protein
MRQNFETPIDAVITWVDGSDPAHKEKLEKYLLSVSGARPHSANPARFNCAGEIEFCVVSLLRFAPWLRTIYIVSDDQQPKFMEKLKGTIYEQRVKVIDHKTIFAGREDCLPSFNSMAISSLLWRIPGIAEKFLFLNDDFMLIRPVTPDVFFRNGQLVLRGHWQLQAQRRLHRVFIRSIKLLLRIKEKLQPAGRVRFVGVQENCARFFGFIKKVFLLEHNPHPWLLSQWRYFDEVFAEELQKNCQFQLRSATQLAPEGIIAHLALKNNEAIIDNKLKTLQLKPADQAFMRIKNKLARAERNEAYIFVCIQSLENAPEKSFDLLSIWLRKKIGNWDEFVASEASGKN